MSQVLIIGYGNTSRGDDGIGWRVADTLRRDAQSRRGGRGARVTPSSVLCEPEQNVRVLQAHQLTPELAEDLSRAETAIFVDAAADLPAGRIRCSELAPATGNSGFTHQFTPENLLDLSATLYGHSPSAFAISIGGASFDLSNELSDEIEAELPRLIEFVKGRARYLAGPASHTPTPAAVAIRS